MAENEVAHAGIGVDVGVNGLDSLIKADSVLENIRQNAVRLHDVTANIVTHIQNQDSFNEAYRKAMKLNHGVNSKVDFKTTGEQSVNDEIDKIRHKINKDVHLQLIGTDYANHEIEYLNKPAHKDVKFNVDTGAIDNVTNTFHKVSHGADQAKQKSNQLAKSGEKIHGIFSGTFIGNAASNAFSAISNGAKSAIQSGMQMVETGDQVHKAWQHIGVGNSNADQMVEQMDHLRDAAGMDEQSLQEMQRRFYVLTGSASRARQLTDEMVSFGKASGESSQEIGRMGRTLPRLLSTSKVRASMFNRTLGQDPALFNAIIKASGMTKSSFQQLLNSGKMTSTQIQQYMQKAAKGSSHAMDEYYHTFQGQVQAIRGTWNTAKEDFSKPFVSNLTNAINQTTKSAGGLQKVQGTVGRLSKALGKRAGDYMGKAIGWIVKNQKPLVRTGTAIFRILKAIGSGVWKEFITVLNALTGGSQKSSKSFNNFSKTLSRVASHTKQLQTLGHILAAVFIISKVNKFNRSLVTMIKKLTGIKSNSRLVSVAIGSINHQWERSGHATARLYMKLSTLRHPIIQAKISSHNLGLVMRNVWHKSIYNVKSFGHTLTWANLKQKLLKFGTVSLRSGITGLKLAQIGFKDALLATPLVGWIQIAIDGIMALYAHSAKFRALVNPLLRGIGHMIGLIGNGIADCIEGVIHFAKGVGSLASKVTGLFHHSRESAARTHSSMNRYTRNSELVYSNAQHANKTAVGRAHKSIDAYRKNSSGKFRAYISKNGQIYRKYHKGTTRISETTYKQREALRKRYYARYESSLKKYEANYKKYENKRSSLSRRYGKLRAMYSEKSLKTIENRFKGLRNTVVRYAKTMFRDTQRIFRHLGIGASKQFHNIYKAVRKYLRMSNREAVRDFKQLYRTSRRYLNGSVLKYVKELQYRYKKQRYYDAQLVKQAKATAKSMYKLPLGWITRETKDLIGNWKHQRASYITHNERMTHAEVSHLTTMTHHLNTFGDHFQKMMSDLEDSIYDSWSKFWSKMHNRAGSGMNAVQAPLNSGAVHINSFVRAFGETSSPMHEMPEVSYSTGTGFRKPITQMTDAVLNDGIDSPETNHQETVIHPDGNIEFPKGQNIHEMLEPGTEVLNATETKLMSQMAHFAPTIHFATGTGDLNDHHLSNVINNSLSNDNSITNKPAPEVAHDIVKPIMKPVINVTPQVHLANGTGMPSRSSNDNNSVSNNTANNVNNQIKTLTSLATHDITNATHENNPLSHIINNNSSTANTTRPLNPEIKVAPTVHFDSGTGIFGGLFNKMSGWLKSAIEGINGGDDYSTIYAQAKGSGNHKLLHILQKVLGHSEPVLAGFMGHAPTGYKGALGDITKGIYGQTSNQIDQWWKVLMSLTNQALNNGASSSEILNYAEKHWMGVPYVYGATSNSGADCGGAVQSILRHFGINISHTDMEDSPAVRFVGSSESNARPGDLVMFGKHSGSKAGASSHVGIYSGHGQMWNECPPKSTISSVKAAADADGLWGFYRLRNAPSNNNNLSDIKTNNPLGGFVKHQEAPMFKWIEKHLAPLLNPDPGGGPGVAKWRSVIEQAAEKMHVHLTDDGLRKVMSNIQHESGGDEAVTQKISDINSAEGDPAIGLVQFIPPTFRHYAVAGHDNIRSGYDQLLALFNDSNWFSDIAPGGGWGPSGSRRMQSGGHIKAGEVATVGEQGEELFKPDVSGTVIPHNTTKKVMNNSSRKPVNIEQKITVNANGHDSISIKRAIQTVMEKSNDNLMEKLNRLGGNDEGGILI